MQSTLIAKMKLYSDIRDRDTYCEVGNKALYSLQDFIVYNGFQKKPANVQFFQWLLHIASRQKGVYMPYYIMLMAERIYEYDLEYAYKGVLYMKVKYTIKSLNRYMQEVEQEFERELKQGDICNVVLTEIINDFFPWYPIIEIKVDVI